MMCENITTLMNTVIYSKHNIYECSVEIFFMLNVKFRHFQRMEKKEINNKGKDGGRSLSG